MAKKDYSECLLIQAPTAHANKPLSCPNEPVSHKIRYNKTRQGYARKRTLKPAGYFFVRFESATPGWAKGR
jgi:hypothetical protein